jgi:hypothetical protein
MSTEKRPYVIVHKTRMRDGKKMNVIVNLLPATVDQLGDPEPSVYRRAERYICRRFVDEVKKKYGIDITVTFDQLLPPDPGPMTQPHASQVRSSYGG